MGYRHYFYKVNRSDVEKIKNLSINELKKEYGDTDGYVDIHELIPQKQIHEFGKLYYDDTAIQLYETGKPLFNNENVTHSWEYEYSIFNLIFLLKTIDWEKETILFYGW